MLRTGRQPSPAEVPDAPTHASLVAERDAAALGAAALGAVNAAEEVAS